MSAPFFLVGVGAYLSLAFAAVALGRHPRASRLVYGGCLFLGAALTLAATAGLIAPTVSEVSLPLGLTWIGAHFRADPLAAFFLLVVNLGAAASSLFSLGHGVHEPSPGRVLPFFPLFLAAMNLVVLAADAFSFLFSWELMSLASWALVVVHHREAANLRAGLIYIVMASLGTLSLLLAFGLLAGQGGGYTFAEIRAHHLDVWDIALVLPLIVIGAGSKAGLVPLHAWLPLAHPAAPSQVSALMSGVMTKVAVYAFVRIVFDLIGPIDWGWSMPVIALGGASALMGVLYALMQHDLKRLLAYHTVENIGIIFIGLGLALAFRANGLAAYAALAMTAALFHVFNHSVFKSLLFLGAGAVHAATDERDIEKLGGLIHRMPQTALAFLIGCAAISALPPLNGFASEWMTFQAMFLSPGLPQWGLRFLIPAVAAVLALAAALAAACFVKAFGIVFLGRPRGEAARNATETEKPARLAMFGLAGMCVLAGAAPAGAVQLLQPVVGSLVKGAMPQASLPWSPVSPTAHNSYDGFHVLLAVIVGMLVVSGVSWLLSRHALRRAPAWDCGFPDANPTAQYTASSFAQPIRRVFGPAFFRATEQVSLPPPGSLAPAKYHAELRDLIWDWFYAPVQLSVNAIADRINVLQFLTIRRYLSIVFTALLLLLLILAVWPW